MNFKEQLLKDFPGKHVYSNEEIEAVAENYVAKIKKDILEKKSSGFYTIKKKLFGGKYAVFRGGIDDPIGANKNERYGVTRENAAYFWKCVHTRLAEEGLGQLTLNYGDPNSSFDRYYVVSFEM